MSTNPRQRHIVVTHYVAGTVPEVFAGFTEDLFERLSPKLPPATLLRYDGNAVGDLVRIRLGVAPLAQEWVSEITEHEEGPIESYFVDVGRRLPWPLATWRHVHRIQKAGPDRVAIVEDITFSASTGWLTRLMAPIIRAQFEARGEKYHEYFGKPPFG